MTPDELADQQPRQVGERACSNPVCGLRFAHRGPCVPQSDAPSVRRADEELCRLLEYPIGVEPLRDALAAAFDVEEMAREAFVADSGQDRVFALRIWFAAADEQPVKQHWRRVASAQRAAFLGPDQ